VAESTIVKTRIDGTLQFAALGGGAYNTSTGALNGGAESYTLAFEAGDLSLNLPSRAVSHYKDRGRTTNPPSIRYGEDQDGSITFSCHLRDLSDASAATLSDIISTMAGNARGYVGSNWESTRASSSGAGDAEVFSIAFKLTITNAGDGTDTHAIACNYVVGQATLTEGDPSSFSFSGVIYDRVDQVYIA
jgi:hypothetical protein